MHCYRHPDVETGIRCARCEKPICPQCMVSAAVGFQCPDCVRGGSGTGHAPHANTPRTVAGGRVVADGRLVTKILIGINLALFIAVRAADPRLVDQLDMIGLAYSDELGIIGVADGEWYRLITSAFLHQEAAHFVFNMLGLWVIGGIVEPELGRIRYTALCLLSGLSGSAMVYLLSPENEGALGASGIVFGLIGAWVVLARRHRYDMRPVLIFVAISLVFTFARPGVSWQAHIGGLVAGALLTYAFVHAPRARRALVQYGACGLLLAIDLGIVLARSAALT
ncbi:rhomboid family intramembrane serine protease [Streptomyces sp. NPDC046275]|uniref:rhomboid family intramembrane serine protease n=1 Tax=Streptomyces sp. NPDC046275 TaxID=3157201 RepID=UPI0033E37D6B